MTDSEKIALQILLDVRAFGADIQSLCGLEDAGELASYRLLMNTATEAQSAAAVDKWANYVVWETKEAMTDRQAGWIDG